MLNSNDKLREWLTNFVVPTEDDDNDFHITKRKIENKLNKHYYPNDENADNLIIVGSVGRNTHTKKTSDHDVLFILSSDIKDRLDDNKGSAQSQILQEVKNVVKTSYPTTELRADGQVVSFELTKKGTIELIPVFRRSDDKFDFPNTKSGGSWEITNPLPEIKKANELANDYSEFQNIARLIRSWRNYSGIKLKGIVIDSILSEYFSEHNISTFKTLENQFFEIMSYIGLIQEDGFTMIGRQSETYTNEDMTFVSEARRLSDRYNNVYSDNDKINLYVEMFGKNFPGYEAAKSEEFVENMFKMGIKYSLEMSANVSSNSTRKIPLSKYFHSKYKLPGKNQKLEFEITNANVLPKSTKFYWKVRNIEYKQKKHEERGQIVKSSSDNNPIHVEHSNFSGNHFVEVYAVNESIVIGRGHVNVPIDTVNGQEL